MKPLFLSLFIILLMPRFGISQKMMPPSDTTTYTMDTIHSYLRWSCDKHHGTLLLKRGVLKTMGETLISGNFTINMDSLRDLDIENELIRKTLYNTLKSKFFFDVKKYHTATFSIDYAEPLGNNNFKITGDLQIKGITNCIQFQSNITFGKKELTATSENFFIDRTHWGITIYSQQMATSDDSVIVGDEIYIVVHLVGNKQPIQKTENPQR